MTITGQQGLTLAFSIPFLHHLSEVPRGDRELEMAMRNKKTTSVCGVQIDPVLYLSLICLRVIAGGR